MTHTHILVLKLCRVTNFTTRRDTCITDVVLIKFEQSFFFLYYFKSESLHDSTTIGGAPKHGYLLKNEDHRFRAKIRRYCFGVTICVYLFVYHVFVLNTYVAHGRSLNPRRFERTDLKNSVGKKNKY